ncbi:cellulose synthase subunit BcsC-related outer membrane protein, partial [Pseudomonas viridiflava]
DNPTLSPARRALDGLLRDRSAYLVQGLSVRSNNGESGLSKITDVQTPFEARMPVGDYNVALRATPVSLSSGTVKAISAARFGTGGNTGDGAK